MKNLFLILISFGLTACADRSGELQDHNQARLHTAATNPAEERIPPAIQSLAEKSEDELRSEIIRPTIERIRNRRSDIRYATDGARNDIANLNGAILALYNQNATSLISSQELRSYRELLEDGCRPGTVEFCRNLEIFKLDSSSGMVMKRLARSSENVRDYYRYLRFAVELSERVADPELESMFVNRSTELFRTFTRARGQNEELRIHVDFITTTILNGRANLRIDDRVLGEILELVVEGRLSQQLGSGIQSAFLRIVAQNLKSPTLWPKFLEMLTTWESQTFAATASLQLPETYTAAISEIRQNSPLNFSVFSIDDQAPLNKYSEKDDLIYYYIVTRLFNYASIDSMLPFWASTAKNPSRFLDIMENYLRVFLAHSSMRTNQRLSTYYARIRTEGANQSEFLTRALRTSREELTPLWKEYFKRVGRLTSFFEREIELPNRSSRDAEIVRVVERGRTFRDELGQNVKYTVTYPNLLIFAYYAKRFDYHEHFEAMFIRGGITLDANLIIQELMDGRMPPIFEFTDDERKENPISRFELKYAIYYAIRMNLMQLYQIDPADWFREFSEGYLASTKAVLDRWAILFNQQVSSGSLRDFSNACKALRGEAPRIENTVSVESILRRTLLGGLSEDSSVPPMKSVMQMIHGHHSDRRLDLNEGIEVVRSDLNRRLRNLKLMRSFFNQPDLAERSTIIARIDSILKPTIDQRDYVISVTNEIDSLAKNCFIEFSKREDQRKFQLFEMEREHLSYVHLALDALGTMGNGQIRALREANPSHAIWSTPFFSQLDPQKDLLNSANEIIALRSGVHQAAGRIRGYADDYALSGGIQRGNGGTFFYSFRQNDLALRLMHFLANGFGDKRVDSSFENIRLAYPETIRELRNQLGGFGSAPKQESIYAVISNSRSHADKLRMFREASLSAFQEFTHNGRWFFDKISQTLFARQWLRTAVSLHKTKFSMETDSEKLASCTGNCQELRRQEMQSDSRKLLDLVNDMLKNFNLNGQINDSLVLEDFGLQSRFGDFVKGPSYLFFDESNADYAYYGFADDAFNFLVSYDLGFNPEFRELRGNTADSFFMERVAETLSSGGGITQSQIKTRTNIFRDAQDAYRSTLRNQKESLLFPIDEKSLAEINASFMSEVETDIQLAHSFLVAVESEMPKINPQPMQFHRLATPFNHDYWISNGLRGSYLEQIRRFGALTNDIFLPVELRNNREWINPR
jgi:hypothetical protein